MQCTAAKLALRVVVSSGEPLQEQLLIQLQDALPAHATILNVYGCTEVSADATFFDATSWQRKARQQQMQLVVAHCLPLLCTSMPVLSRCNAFQSFFLEA